MARIVHRRLLLIAALLLATACSDNGPTGEQTTSIAPAPSAATTSTAVVTTTSTAVVTTPSTTGPVDTPLPSTSPPVSTGSTVAEVGGWRLVVTEPQPGSTISRTPVVCYALTGTSREPVVAFDVALLPLGATEGATARVDVVVGAGSVVLELPGISEGRYDMRIQLVVDGAVLDGAVVTLPGLTVSLAAGAPTCD